MSKQIEIPKPALKTGERLNGFKVLRVEKLAGIRATAYELVHEKTGAKLLHLHSSEKENVYAIGFRTPPADSTGLPHILEHAVLAGSQKYPLKDVFKELMRSSMQTFINAFTYPDKTIYPVASQIEADFFNLARIYTDLVFNPRLLPETFSQEGHHLEFTEPDNPSSALTISGIVYNEMKGAYSSPNSIIYKTIQENLFPDTVYAHDSGGDPDFIPALTYETFCKYHRTYYSPSNARFFIYGNIPTVKHLLFLEEILKNSRRVKVDSFIKSQRRLTKPRILERTYPADRSEAKKGKISVNVAWLLSENTDYENSLLLEIISGLLVGNSASPLRKALIDSGLGEDLTPVSGMESELKQLMFCVGLRNTKKNAAPIVEKLIFDSLKNIVKTGYDKDLIEGILHQIEFHGKEIVRGSYPYGISLMSYVFQAWLHDGDPLIGLDFPRIIEKIRKLWFEDPLLFQKMTKKWFLDNRHRLLVVMKPDSGFNRKKEKEYRKKMAGLRASLTRAQRQEINRQAQELKKFQSEPDSAEAVATIPKLKLRDIPRVVDTIPSKEILLNGATALVHDIFTDDIAYIDFVFDLAPVPEELQLYLPLLGKMMSGMGAAGLSYEDMARRISLTMGGFGYELTAGLTADSRLTWQKMIFSGKALYRNIPETLNIFGDILCRGDLSDEARMKDLIAERKNNLQSAIVPSGHIFAKRSAGAALSLPAYRDEQWNGRSQLLFVQQTADKYPAERKELIEKLTELKKIIFRRNNLIINLTADKDGIRRAKKSILPMLDKLPTGTVRKNNFQPVFSSVRTGVALSTQVSYVARVLKSPAYTHSDSALLMIAAKELSNEYLYKHIRVQGGAYGATSSYEPSMGLFSFLSYRDPQLVKTLQVFRNAGDFISQRELSAEEMERAIISTISMMDKPMDPSGRGDAALMRYISGVTDKMRRKFREDVLSATPQKLKEAMKKYFSRASKTEMVAVYSSEEKLREANEQLEDKLALKNLFNGQKEAKSDGR